MSPEASSVVYGTTTIEYSIRRTARAKTVAITVDADHGVVLAAPRELSVERLDRIVREKARWIAASVRASDAPPPMTPREFVSGETFLYAGRQHTLRVVAGDSEGASLDHGRLVVHVRREAKVAPAPGQVRELLVRWYEARAEERLGDLVTTWAARMELRPSRVVIASQARRWGSCSPTGELRLNWRIVGASKRLAEYVVAHELMHLRHPDHTPAFWRGLGRAMPDFEDRRTQLRDVGARLVW